MYLTPISPFPFSNSNFKIPSTNYSHTMSLGTPETSPPNNTEVKKATIEIHIQGWYKLFVEPLKGLPPMALENGYVVSPKSTYKFKVPLFILDTTAFPVCVSYVSKELALLPISTCLAMYLEPHIVHNVIGLAQQTSQTMEFKIVFYVKVVKIDLVDNRECDGYRRRGLI